MIPEWVKKILVALVAILTFGTVIPSSPAHYVDKPDNNEPIYKEKSPDEAFKPAASDRSGIPDHTEQTSWTETVSANASKEKLVQAFSDYTLQQLRQQGSQKFGPRVAKEISNVYNQDIAPAFLMEVQRVSDRHDARWIRHLDVTHSPSSGMGERILHVYQTDSGSEVLKLHVRRDHPPKNGYWFDFHYHTAQDGFQKHHELKKIYWGKNMPPKWRA
ncbi:YpjP family protein [Sporolactobacillus vineae]|uniref:YpjP family protein n=1 Tax=Sporolactobacillus vineae TaxID=444463 RepID=UPI000289A415|nr:YpjP family protein [Sporolactobacillus vineae]